jgi:hypothetical protein
MAKRPFAVISVQLSDSVLPTAAALDRIHVAVTGSDNASVDNRSVCLMSSLSW